MLLHTTASHGVRLVHTLTEAVGTTPWTFGGDNVAVVGTTLWTDPYEKAHTFESPNANDKEDTVMKNNAMGQNVTGPREVYVHSIMD